MAEKESVDYLLAMVADVGPRLHAAVADEVREGLAEALTGLAVEVEANGRDALAEGPGACGLPIPGFDDSESFAAGVRFAAQLVADRNWDY